MITDDTKHNIDIINDRSDELLSLEIDLLNKERQYSNLLMQVKLADLELETDRVIIALKKKIVDEICGNLGSEEYDKTREYEEELIALVEKERQGEEVKGET